MAVARDKWSFGCFLALLVLAACGQTHVPGEGVAVLDVVADDAVVDANVPIDVKKDAIDVENDTLEDESDVPPAQKDVLDVQKDAVSPKDTKQDVTLDVPDLQTDVVPDQTDVLDVVESEVSVDTDTFADGVQAADAEEVTDVPICVPFCNGTTCNDGCGGLCDGKSCDDGDLCTTGDTCLGMACSGTATACGDGNVCTLDACDATTGACTHTADSSAQPDASACLPAACQTVTAVCVDLQVACVTATVADDSPCPGGKCASGACLPAECTPAATTCSGNGTQVCDSLGFWGATTACKAKESCLDGACQPQICVANATGCAGAIRRVCDSLGLAYAVTEDCAASGDICSNGACIAPVCTPGAIDCGATGPRVCNADSLTYAESPCADGYVCSGGACLEKICTPGQFSCIGKAVIQCGPLGLDFSTAQDCGVSGQTCQAGSCVATVCTAADNGCNGNTASHCSADGLTLQQATCSAYQSCLGGQCVDRTCQPGQSVCWGSVVVTCDALGLSGAATPDCADSGQICWQGKCMPAICTPGDTKCDGGIPYTCNAKGTGWDAGVCSSGQLCLANKCVAAICTPNTNYCQGAIVAACGSDGQSGTPVENCAVSGKACANGACVVAACLPGSKTCDSGHLLTCKTDATGWWVDTCDDGYSCTADGCDAVALTCIHPAIVCEDGNPCTNDQCQYGKCVGAWGDSQPCSDGDACTPLDFCFHGQCQSHGAAELVTIAGDGKPGLVDGLESVARFNQPRGMAERADGSILIADAGNHCIRLWTPGKSVTTFAGSGFAGFMEGDAAIAQFKTPTGVAVGADGTVYVADSGNNRIRQIKNGKVSTFSGTGVAGYLDGPADKAQFSGFAALHTGPDGALWAASSYYIRRIAKDGSVSTFMGGSGPYQKGTGTLWQITYVPPQDFAFAPDGSIFVSMVYNYAQIFRISPQNDVTTAFDANGYMVVDKQGVIWFEDEGNLYRGTTGGSYSLYGGVWSGGFADGVFTAGLLGAGARMLLTSDGTWLISDTVNHALRKVKHALGGCDDGNACTADSCNPDATCSHTILADGQGCSDGNSCTSGDTCAGGSCQSGTLLACGDGNECTDDACDPWTGQCAHTQSIRPCTAGDACNLAMVCSLGTCGPGPAQETTRAGGPLATSAFVDANGLDARFGTGTGGMVKRSDGALIVADTTNGALRIVSPSNDVSTWGVPNGVVGNGPIGSVGTGKPTGIAIDRRGSVFFSTYDQIGRVVQGQVAVWCGGAYSGYADGTCAKAMFKAPSQIAFGADGTLYVADSGNRVIRAISVTGDVTTFAGTGTKGYTDGPVKTAQFDTPRGIAVGQDGSVYVADDGNLRIRKIKGGIVSTVAGGGNSIASPVATSQLALVQPAWLAMDSGGALLISDKNRLWRIVGANATQILGIVPSYTTGYVLDGPSSKAEQLVVAGTVANGDGSVDFVDDHTVRHVTAYIRTCDDGSPCTVDSCDATSGDCKHIPQPEGTPCDDGDACSTGETCLAGTCSGAVTSCDDGEPCTVDSCNPYSATCEHIARPGLCDDGDACSGAAACLSGVCTSKTPLIAHLAGSTDGSLGLADGDPWLSRFKQTTDGCADAAGNVYIADYGNHRVRKVTPQGWVTTLVGNVSASTSATIEGPALATNAPYVRDVMCRASGLAGFVTTDGVFDYIPATDGTATVKKRCGTAGDTVVGGPGVGAANWGADFFGREDGSYLATIVTSYYGNFYYTYTAHLWQISGDGSVSEVATSSVSSSWAGVTQDSAGNIHAVDNYGKIYSVWPGGISKVGVMADGCPLGASPQGSVYGILNGALLRFDPATGGTTTINVTFAGSSDLTGASVVTVPSANRIVISKKNGELLEIHLTLSLCDDGNPCTLDTCDPQTGACAHAPTTASCNDGDACTVGDACNGGKCVGVPMACGATQMCVAGTCTNYFTGTAFLSVAEQTQLNAWAGQSATHTWQKCSPPAPTAQTLFSACAGKGPSYTVISALDPVKGTVHHFGAYQSQAWMTSASSGVNVYAQDSAAFLFSLDQSRKLPIASSLGTYAFWGFYVAPTMPGPKFGQSDLVLDGTLQSGTMNLGDTYSTAGVPCVGSACKGWLVGGTSFQIDSIEVFY